MTDMDSRFRHDHDHSHNDHPYPHHHDHPHDDDHGPGHEHPRRHEHDHPHTHEHDHPHNHPGGPLGLIARIFHLHGHEHASLSEDSAFTSNQLGIRTIWLALAALGITSLLQVVIVALSGSVALLADTVHNIGDTLNSIPLLVAFYLARRVATRRYTYGFGRAEDVAGVFIVLSIAVSAGIVLWESVEKLLNPQPMTNIGWVAAAAVIGFLGNEVVALLQIRVGRKIGSDAMIADGLHARIDGLTSLAVLVAAVGAVIGLPILDPIIGLLIGVAILFITWDATKRIWYRLMDAVDPAVIARIEHAVGHVDGVHAVPRLRARWIGHRLFVDLTIDADAALTLHDSTHLAEHVREAVQRSAPHIGDVLVQVESAHAH